MRTRTAALIVAGFMALPLVGACASNRDMVDGKAEVTVPMPTPVPSGQPTTVICYLLEIEREDAQGNEVGEGYQCVDKATWDRNREGEQLVDASGKVVK